MAMLLLAVLLWKMASTGGQTARNETPSYTDFLAAVDKGNVSDVTINLSPVSAEVDGEFRDPKAKFQVTIPKETLNDLIKDLESKGAVVNVKEVQSKDWPGLLIDAIPFVLLLVIFIFIMRQMQAGGNKALSFGKSRARLLTAQQKKATFKDVAGIEEAKEELQEIIDFLKDPQKFQKLGGRIPKGVLLVGPPGTGKTLLARAIAGEANVPFFSISGSDFVEMFVGVGASRVRDLFEQGKKNAPCIIFIDEIDAVGRHRGAGLGGGHDEREQTLNALLVEMDGFAPNQGIVVIAATNRPDILDKALMRPGRFDRQVTVANPDLRGREAILAIHSRKVPTTPGVDLRAVARGTPGFSGADLANLVNEAALLAARAGRHAVDASDLEKARDKVLMGVERRSLVMTDDERKTTAYHEAGHAVVAAVLPHADPIHKVTIVPRGRALGVMMQLPEFDRHTHSKAYLEAQLAILMGGRVAEEIYTGRITSGAGNDIERATEIARRMVCEFGMSSFGPVAFRRTGAFDEDRGVGYSEATARRVDDEIRDLVMKGYETARQLVSRHKTAVAALADELLQVESLDADGVRAIIDDAEGLREAARQGL